MKKTVRVEPSPELLTSLKETVRWERRERWTEHWGFFVHVYLFAGASAGFAALLVLLVKL